MNLTDQELEDAYEFSQYLYNTLAHDLCESDMHETGADVIKASLYIRILCRELHELRG